LLKQKKLKYIIPRTQAGNKSISLNIYLTKKQKEKFIPIHLCLNKKEAFPIQKPEDHPFTILFITSLNDNRE
jgi:hypothetical protein